ncbi:hypothetical protein IEQ11_03215 [Lysobacter capsici]|uniref:hypothetical protein n=1 Tax=Lysobacter capsici TaxID=435897 RepID=UPI0017828870|nr:hypothetical protein [Lysobacter capsici]UOF15694.1 hypothetical protein IEQ11_03215 [Lysobacter capsici]
MRNDMYKVIVERPRRGGGNTPRARPPRDLDDHPSHEAMKYRYGNRKWLNENLRPLQRYLQGQVGRRWDFVYSELCARVDRRNTVQQHIHLHLEDFVAMQVFDIKGTRYVMQNWRGLQPLAEARHELYVDPDNGCLMRNEAAIRLKIERHREHRLAVHARQAEWEPGVRKLDATTQLRRIDGIWYRIELMPMPEPSVSPGPQRRPRTLPRTDVYDAVTHCLAKNCASARWRMYGTSAVYAHRKLQLSQSELNEHRLKNDTSADSYVETSGRDTRRRRSHKYRAPIRNDARRKDYSS